jgi:hypothetical protein
MHRDTFHCNLFEKKYRVLRLLMMVARRLEFSLIIRDTEVFTLHLVPTMGSKETVMLHRVVKFKVIETSERYKLTVEKL